MAIIIPLDELIVPEDRIRKTIIERDVRDLADSITNLGLMQAPVVQKDGRTLVAGYRRRLAITYIYEHNGILRYQGEDVSAGYIPVVPLSELSPIAVREAELHENVKRVQLTWQEKAAAVKQLHELREEQAEAEGRKHYAKDTAIELLGDSFHTSSAHEVREDLTVAAFLDDEDVAKATSRKEAIKIIQKKLEIGHRKALAKEFDVGKLDTEHTIIQGDLIETLPKLEMTTIDCIICDPPYGIDADKFANMSARKHSYVDSASYSNAIVSAIAIEGMRITKPKAHLYMFCDINRFLSVKKLLEEAGWTVFNTPLIWYKGSNNGIAPWPTGGPRRTYEAIVFATKGKRNVMSIYPDVLSIPYEHGTGRAASKPVSLYQALISYSCYAGDTVLDPCCGTGPIFPAATATRTIATGIEIDPEAIGIAIERIKGEDDEV